MTTGRILNNLRCPVRITTAILAFLIGALPISPGFGQGTVQFLNSGLTKIKYQEAVGAPTVDAPLGTVISLYWGVESNRLALVTNSVIASSPGLFVGIPIVPIPGTEPGQQGYLRIVGEYSGLYGATEIVQCAPLGPTTGPSVIIWQIPMGTNPNRMKPFTIGPGLRGQTIEFEPLGERALGEGPILLYASSSSGLPVTFSSSNPSVASVENTTLTLHGTGSTLISASQAGDGNGNVLPASVSRLLVVKARRCLVHLSDLVQVYTGSVLQPSWTTEPPGRVVVATYNGSPIPPHAAGTYQVAVSIADTTCASGTNGSFVIERAPQSIEFAEPGVAIFQGSAVPLTVSSPFGLPVTLTSSDPMVAQISGASILPGRPGNAVITARQAGNENVFPAAEVTRTIRVECTLQLSVSGQGSVGASPSLTTYPGGTEVRLTPLPAPGHAFVRWSGSLSGSSVPATVVMDQNHTVSAEFVSVEINVTANGGRVLKAPDLPSYAYGQSIVLSAIPDRWQVFSRWTDGSLQNPRTVVAGQGDRYTAVFVPETPLETTTIGQVSRTAPVGMPAFVVDGVFVPGPNHVTRGPAIVSMQSSIPDAIILYSLDGQAPDFASEYYAGPLRLEVSALIRAIAYAPDLTVDVDSDPLAIEILPTLEVTADGGGTVATSPATGRYRPDGTAELTATPWPGWKFLEWRGDVSGATTTTTVRMDRHRCVEAVFGTSVSHRVAGSGDVLRDDFSQGIPFGSGLRLTAVPADGSYFAFWANSAVGTANPLSLVVTSANPSVTAVFANLDLEECALTVIPDGFGNVLRSPDRNRYGRGATVTLNAVPDEGQSFLGWQGDATGAGSRLTLSLTTNRTLVARFSRRPTLRVQQCPGVRESDAMKFLVTGAPGQRYRIESKNDPSEEAWTVHADLENSFGVFQFSEAIPPGGKSRIYRAIESR